MGAALRYVAEYQGQWVALLVFGSSALHLKPRDRFLQWSAHQVKQRRHLIAQNTRFLVLADPGQWPNLASRVLKLVCERLSQDWQQHFGHPVLLVETFVDPQRFRGTCYKACGWQRLGPTQGFQRQWQDFYIDTEHPKELWVRPLTDEALEQLRAEQLAPALLQGQATLPPPCPVATAKLDSLWECFHQEGSDPRKARGIRHKLASFLVLCALAICAGCKGPQAMAEFARSLNHAQRERLRCRPRKSKARQYDVPSERTFRRLLKRIDEDQLKEVIVGWMAQQDPTPVTVLHVDGKAVKNAHPAPPRPAPEAATPSSPAEPEPKANKMLMLVNFQTTEQRLVEQIVVPADTNEEAAVAAHLPKMDLAGVCISADAAHTTKANCRQLTQENGAEFLLTLNGKQPLALAKAEQLLPGDFPPSGHNDR